MPTVSPYGEWKSPITTKMLVAGSVRLGGIALDGECAYWLEGRPSEGGRNVLVCRDTDGAVRDVTPAPFNVRTRAHEYGGGAFLVRGGRVWFVNFADQRLYQLDQATAPRALTAAGPWRYADMILDPHRERLICVREAHGEDGSETINTLVAVGLHDGGVEVLAEGHDFYASPCLSADATKLAWITWDHPDMPWDATRLWLAEFDNDGSLAAPEQVAGGDGESVFQPAFRNDGVLFFVSDPDGWWNLYRRDGADNHCVLPMEAEFGRPQWQFGMSTYGFDGQGQIMCCYASAGFWHLARLAAEDGKLQPIDAPFTDIQAIAVDGPRALVIGGSTTSTAVVALVDTTDGATVVLRESAPKDFGEDLVSKAQAIAFATGDGGKAHAFYYPPCNPDYRGPDHEQPPLPGQHRFRTRLPRVAQRTLGNSGRRGLHQRRAPPGRFGARGCRAADYSRQQCRWLHYPCGARLSRRFFRRRQLLRRQRFRDPCPGHPQIRIPLSGWFDRRLPGAAGSLPGAFADSRRGASVLPGYFLPGIG